MPAPGAGAALASKLPAPPLSLAVVAEPSSVVTHLGSELGLDVQNLVGELRQGPSELLGGQVAALGLQQVQGLAEHPSALLERVGGRGRLAHGASNASRANCSAVWIRVPIRMARMATPRSLPGCPPLSSNRR